MRDIAGRGWVKPSDSMEHSMNKSSQREQRRERNHEHSPRLGSGKGQDPSSRGRRKQWIDCQSPRRRENRWGLSDAGDAEPCRKRGPEAFVERCGNRRIVERGQSSFREIFSEFP